jgi:hypothetical protein
VASWAASDVDVAGRHTAEERYKALFDGLDSPGTDAAPGEQTEL